MIELLHGPVARPQHVAVVEVAAGTEHAVHFVENTPDPQVAGGPLERDQIEMIVGGMEPPLLP